MGSLIVLLLIIVTTFFLLCYMFNEARISIDNVTIAAVEATAGTLESKRETSQIEEKTGAREKNPQTSSKEMDNEDALIEELSSPAVAAKYEYREMLEEGGENFVLPQWMVNFFSSSDICHTLDPSDELALIIKLHDPKNAETGFIDISAESDMSTQTISLKLCFGEGAAAENLKTKFYLFERGDLFELSRLVRQNEMRIDILSRAADYTLEYVDTVRAKLPQNVLSQIKNALARIPS